MLGVSKTKNVRTDRTGERSLRFEAEEGAIEEACTDVSQGSENAREQQCRLPRFHTLHGMHLKDESLRRR